ncbi:MAG: hypothetical protein ABJA67_10915 [Chthonomonadales bacterium]
MSLLKPDFAISLADAKPPCISFFQPTHRHYPENQKDVICFRNLIKKLEHSLQTNCSADVCTHILKPFHELALDGPFWLHAIGGLAIFAADGIFEVITTQRSLDEMVLVGPNFHTTPLLRLLQSTDRFQVLALNRQSIKLFEGDRDSLHEIGLATDIQESLGNADGKGTQESHDTVGTLGGAGKSGTPVRYSSTDKSHEVEIDDDRYFRAVDHAIHENYSKPTGLPLILATLPEHHARFVKLSHNPFLAKEYISINPEHLATVELCAHAWKAFEPAYDARIAKLNNDFAEANSKGLGSDILKSASEAAVAGRVETLIVEGNRLMPGRINEDTGRTRKGSQDDPRVDDMLDELGDIVTKMGGRVLIVPADKMPSKTGLAAIYRY